MQETHRMLSKLRLTTIGLVLDKKLDTRLSWKIEGDIKKTLRKLRSTQQPGDHFVCLKSFEGKGEGFTLFEPHVGGRYLVERQSRSEVREILHKEDHVFRLRLGQMLAFKCRNDVVRISNRLTRKGSVIEISILDKSEAIPPSIIIELTRSRDEKERVMTETPTKKTRERRRPPLSSEEEWTPSRRIVGR